jgi:hypothetical protein
MSNLCGLSTVLQLLGSCNTFRTNSRLCGSRETRPQIVKPEKQEMVVENRGDRDSAFPRAYRFADPQHPSRKLWPSQRPSMSLSTQFHSLGDSNSRCLCTFRWCRHTGERVGNPQRKSVWNSTLLGRPYRADITQSRRHTNNCSSAALSGLRLSRRGGRRYEENKKDPSCLSEGARVGGHLAPIKWWATLILTKWWTNVVAIWRSLSGGRP